MLFGYYREQTGFGIWHKKLFKNGPHFKKIEKIILAIELIDYWKMDVQEILMKLEPKKN